jgi:hypothetical protein
MVTVQVFSESTGKPEKDKRVAIGKNGLLSTGVTKTQYTDSNGEAHFDTDPTNDGEIFVDGREVHRGRVSGKMTVYV